MAVVFASCPGAFADADRLGAFAGAWQGQGEKVEIDSFGGGKQTGGPYTADQNATTAFKITSARVAGGNLIADYAGDTTGSLIFYCAANDDTHRSSITQNGLTLAFDGPNDLFKGVDDTIKDRRQQYCAQ